VCAVFFVILSISGFILMHYEGLGLNNVVISGEFLPDKYFQLAANKRTVHAINATDKGTIYVGTDYGLYRSEDDGKTWTQLEQGLFNQNIHALAVDGDFDDCQAQLKNMFNDFEFRDGVRLAGVNSINWARVLAQVVYYFTAAVALGAPHRAVSFTVPTGNFGDIFAGTIAKKMGLPIEQLVIATNQNDILHRALVSGAYTTRGVTATISPSMDIQVSSNFERALFNAYGQDGAAVAQQMESLHGTGGFDISQGAIGHLRDLYGSARASEDETRATISTMYASTGQLLCPHSAVAVKAAQECAAGDAPMIALATAHPAKFPDAVEAATGIRPPLPAHMADLFSRPERISKVANDLGQIETLIRDRIKR
jgi:threonine synthase